MMVMGDGPPKDRGRHRVIVENDMVRKREREFRHQQMWSNTKDYYKRWDKINNKFDEWTSPRYYEDNNKMVSEIKQKRLKEELLEKRREKLLKLFNEEDNSYQIELMVKKSLHFQDAPATSTKAEEVPTDVLKDINNACKLKEEEKRKREAELKLYHQWRINNPIVRQFESKYRFKDLKLSWLDQQIEKRMQKEKEEKECKQFIKEQEEKLRREREHEKEMKRQVEEKMAMLKEDLDKQVAELKEKQRINDDLKNTEAKELTYKKQLEELEEKAKEEEKRRSAREHALYNIRQHKMKLKQKAIDVQEALRQDQELLTNIKRLQLEELIENQKKKEEIKRGLQEFLAIVKDQQELEKQRQKHLDFLFESEAKTVCDKQLRTWNDEEKARKKLLKEVLDTVKDQIACNLQKNKERQKEVLHEREEMMQKIERYDKELQELQEKEQQRKKERKRTLDDEVKLKNAKKKQEENMKLKEIDEELERVKKEEERLNREILEIQKRQGPLKPRGRSRLLY